MERLGSLQGFYELVHGGAARKKRKERRRIAKKEREREKERAQAELKHVVSIFLFPTQLKEEFKQKISSAFFCRKRQFSDR